MNACPAIVSVPVRGDVDVLAATVYATEPLPVPLAPLVTVTHETALEAVHGQAEGRVTVTEPCPPLAFTDVETGARVAVHTTPACVTVNV